MFRYPFIKNPGASTFFVGTFMFENKNFMK